MLAWFTFLTVRKWHCHCVTLKQWLLYANPDWGQGEDSVCTNTLGELKPNQKEKHGFFSPCGVHIKSFLISSVPLSWMHARGQHVWGRTKSWWTLAVHHSSQERRTDPGAFTGLSPSHQAAASECERPHNPQSPPEPIAPSFLPSNSPLSIFFFLFLERSESLR